MCAITDNKVVAQAFGSASTPAGEAFHESLDAGMLRLIVGGELLGELDANRNFRA